LKEVWRDRQREALSWVLALDVILKKRNGRIGRTLLNTSTLALLGRRNLWLGSLSREIEPTVAYRMEVDKGG
jgi:hypothetical protein